MLRSGSSDRSIALRADMDALPIEEENDFEHRSRNPGKMHACGHDGHTAMLLGAAKHLSENRSFDGTVYFFFQPAEEKDGGARVMIEEGALRAVPGRGGLRRPQLPGDGCRQTSASAPGR